MLAARQSARCPPKPARCRVTATMRHRAIPASLLPRAPLPYGFGGAAGLGARPPGSAGGAAWLAAGLLSYAAYPAGFMARALPAFSADNSEKSRF